MKHQYDVLEQTKDKNKVAFYLDMGLGWLTQNLHRIREGNKPTQKHSGSLSEVKSWRLGWTF